MCALLCVLCALLCAGGAVSQADVDKYHAQFYDALAGLFTRHAHRHPAFKDAKLTLLYSHHH